MRAADGPAKPKTSEGIDFPSVNSPSIQPRVPLRSLFVSRFLSRSESRHYARAASPLYNELPEIYARFVSRLAYNRPSNYFQLPCGSARAYRLIIS